MARSAFERVIELQLGRYGPEAAKRKHIEIARRGLAEHMARQSVKPSVTIEVDGRPAASEQSVKPFGVIVYRFGRMREIVGYALDQAQRLSPKLSGRYRDSWFAMVGGREIALADVPQAIVAGGPPILVTNDQPYSRKINVGAKGYERYAPPGVVEKVRQLVRRKYGAVIEANVEFITLSGGHKLKRQGVRRRKNGTVTARSDMRPGSDLTYPALRLSARI